MSNKTNSTRTNNAVVRTDNHDVARKTNNQAFGEKYRDQFTEFVLDMERDVINTIKKNVGDYKAISEDKNMTPVDKAVGKRKVLAADIGLGTLGIGSMLGMVWLAKKVFAA